MPLPFDIFEHTNVARLLAAWVASQPDGVRDEAVRRLARELGCSRALVWNLIGGDRKVKAEQVPALARVLELSEEQREYLRRVVAVHEATPQELKAAALSMWELQARHIDVPTGEIAALQAEDVPSGAAGAALLPALRLLDGLGARPEARELQQLLILPPLPDALKEAVALRDRGEGAGERLDPRLWRMPEPAQPEDPETLLWHGLEAQAGEHLLGLRPAERDFKMAILSADGPARHALEQAQEELEAGLLALVQAHAQGPVGRTVVVLSHVLTLSRVMPTRPASCPTPATDPEPLSTPDASATVQEGAGQPADAAPLDPGRPCLYHHLSLASYGRAWQRWQETRKRPLSLRWLAKRAELSPSYVHALITGAALLPVHHVPALARAFDLDEDERQYLEGLALLARATDREEQWRLKHSLLRFAAQKKHRTLEGERFRAFATWAPLAVLALADLPVFRNNVAWISLALNGRVTLQEARELVPILMGAGLLAPSEVGPPRPTISESIDDPFRGLAGFSCYYSLLRLQRGELMFPTEDRRYRGWTLALPEEADVELRALLLRHVARITEVHGACQARRQTGQSPPDRVVLCSQQLYPLTHPLTASVVLRRRRP